MTDLNGKVFVVTGASSGIGKGLASRLVSLGSKVVGCARNLESLQEIAKNPNKKGPGKMYPMKCDVSIEDDLLNVFKFVEDNFDGLHGMINNAGIGSMHADILNGKTEDWRKLLDTNTIATAVGCREAVKTIKKFRVDAGHIVIVNSILGKVVQPLPVSHVYGASKFAIDALAQGLRYELRSENSHIRVTQVSPGVTRTEIYERVLGVEIANSMLAAWEILEVEDVVDAIIYALQTHPRINVDNITMTATEEINMT